MQIVSKRTLVAFWEKHPQAEGALAVWFAIASKSEWKNPADIKRQFGTTVDFVGDNRIIFDVKGNDYRLVVHVSYRFKAALIKFVGTHKEYDRIDPETV